MPMGCILTLGRFALLRNGERKMREETSAAETCGGRGTLLFLATCCGYGYWWN